MTAKSNDTIRDVPITKIYLGRNPRRKFNEEKLQGLAQNIEKRGQQQPIVLEPYKDGFILVMGERRLRAHKLLGRTTIKAIIRARSNHNGRERFLDALVENDQREEMTAIETAHAYRVLLDEFHMTQRQIAIHIGKPEKRIGDLLLLTELDEEIQEMIEQGLSKDPRLARGLLKIQDTETRVELARRLWRNKVSLQSCLVAVERVLGTVKAIARKIDFKRGTPALQMAEVDEQPMRWDMLMQLGKAPDWDIVVQSAQQTCRYCPLREIANRITCQDCGAVYMLRKMMEVGNGGA